MTEDILHNLNEHMNTELLEEDTLLETNIWIADKARFAILIAMLNNYGLKDYNSGGSMSNEQKEA